MGARRYALRSLVSYRVKHSKRNPISTHAHVFMILCLFFGLMGYHFTECCVSTLNLSGLVSDCRSAHIYQYDPCQTGFNFFFKKWGVFGK